MSIVEGNNFEAPQVVSNRDCWVYGRYWRTV